MKSFREIANEAVRTLADAKIDSFIGKEWDNSAITYEYNLKAVMELATIFKDIVVNKEKTFFHIPAVQDAKSALASDKILAKYKLKEI